MELLSPSAPAVSGAADSQAPRDARGGRAAPVLQGIVRTHDVIGGHADLEHLFSFPGFPVYLGCTLEPAASDKHVDLSFAISRGSGCVQLDRLVPLDVLYASNHAPVVGATWEAHHREFARFVAGFAPRQVLEIGGAHGMLCKNVQGLLPDVAWTIVEPNPIPVEGLRAHFIAAFFDHRFRTDVHHDMIVHSHTLEHMYAPRQFIADVARLAQPGDHHCFSVPDLRTWLQRGYTNAMNFEHSFLLTEADVQALLAEQGFRVVAREPFGDQHSVFYATVKAEPGSIAPQPVGPGAYAANKALILDYRSKLLAEVQHLNAQIQRVEGPVFLFGAHVFSQTLLALGLDSSRIDCLLDNAAMKHGQRLYGTQLQVRGPAALRGLDRPVVVIRAGAYEAEIKAAILRDHNPGTVFI
jgi:hypothetical protein